MWDRVILKANARQALSGGRYWTAYAACVIVSLITDIFGVGERFVTQPDNPFTSYGTQSVENWWDNVHFSWVWCPDLLVYIFVGLALTVGISRFFVRNRFGETKLETVFSGFQDNYMNTMGAMFTTRLFCVLWGILLIIPGIVKLLEYSMVKYILSDNPSMPGSRARQISGMMTNGEKGAIFVLYLSFLGWYILAMTAAAILGWISWAASGILSVAAASAVTAYQEATLAELYIFLRDRAIQNGMVNPVELGLVPPAA